VGCAPCAKKRQMIRAAQVAAGRYKLTYPDGNEETYPNLAEAQQAARKVPGTKVAITKT
jgi:endonuclease YncB( thermonuclease family)